MVEVELGYHPIAVILFFLRCANMSHTLRRFFLDCSILNVCDPEGYWLCWLWLGENVGSSELCNKIVNRMLHVKIKL